MNAAGWGRDPVRPGDQSVDRALVITAGRRYPQQAASPPPTGPSVGDSDTMAEVRQAPPPPATIETLDELRRMEVATLRERVIRSEYQVDTHAVAGAIIARLLAERPASETSK